MASSLTLLQTLLLALLMALCIEGVGSEQSRSLKERSVNDDIMSLLGLPEDFDEDKDGDNDENEANYSPYNSGDDGENEDNYGDDDEDDYDSYYDDDSDTDDVDSSSRLETVSPLSGDITNDGITPESTSTPNYWNILKKYLPRNDWQDTDSQQDGGNERDEEKEQVLIPEQLQQQEWQGSTEGQQTQEWQGSTEGQQTQEWQGSTGQQTQEWQGSTEGQQTQEWQEQEEYQIETSGQEHKQQDQQQQQQQSQYQIGGAEQQQQALSNASVISNYNNTYLNSSASVSSQNGEFANISGSVLVNNNSGNDSKETSNPRCSTEPDFSQICNISTYPNNSSHVNPFTFSTLENTIANYTTKEFLKSCQPGQWCLGSNDIWRALENFPKHLCQPSLLTCIENVVENLTVCPTYQKYTTIYLSLDLVCEYIRQDPELEHWKECGIRVMQMLSVTLSNLERETPLVQNSDICKSQTGLMLTGFRCLMHGCSALEKTSDFTHFPPWQWFTDSLSSHRQCLLNCSQEVNYNHLMPITQSSSYAIITSASTSTTQTVTSTTKSTKDVANLQYNAVRKSEQTGIPAQVSSPTNIIVIATAVAVGLIVAMSIIIIIIVWRKMKHPDSLRNQGYSRLKSGEC